MLTLKGSAALKLARFWRNFSPEGVIVTAANSADDLYFVQAPKLAKEHLGILVDAGYYVWSVGERYVSVGSWVAEYGKGEMEFKDLQEAVDICNSFGVLCTVVHTGKKMYLLKLAACSANLRKLLEEAGYTLDDLLVTKKWKAE